MIYRKPRKYSVEYALESALKFNHKADWRAAEPKLVNAISQRDMKLYRRCVAHMVPLPNLYSGPFTVYACEFSDGFAYIGLTHNLQKRLIGHSVKGAVFNHVEKTRLEFTVKVLEDGIPSQKAAQDAEKKWQENYLLSWNPLHSAQPGSLGARYTWTPSKVKLDSLNYKTRSGWCRRCARKTGWL